MSFDDTSLLPTYAVLSYYVFSIVCVHFYIFIYFSFLSFLFFPSVSLCKPFFCLSIHLFFITLWYNIKMLYSNLSFIKAAATDIRYLARSNFSRSLVPKKKFSLIWLLVFKLCHIFGQEEGYLFWVWMSLRQVASDNNSRWICKEAIIKQLSLAYSFRKMFFIGQNLKHVYATYFFLERLDSFWLTLVDINCQKFVSHHIKEYCMRIQIPKETNHEIKTCSPVSVDVEKSCLLMSSLNSLRAIFNFSQFHEHIFRNSNCSLK